MSCLISIKNVSYESNYKKIFEDISITLNSNEKIGLIAPNGIGKTTFLNILNKNIEPDKGNVSHSRDMVLYVLEQSFPKKFMSKSILDAVIDILPEDERDYDYWKAELALEKVGINPDMFQNYCSELSGGWQMRVLFARAIVFDPNVLLFDEPTNNLDLPTILWLEDFLVNYKGSLIVISHDESILDKVTDYSWIISSSSIYKYGFSCSEALKAHAEYEDDILRQNNNESREIKRLEVSAKRLAIMGKNYDSEKFARKAKSMFKHINKLIDSQVEILDKYPWRLSFSGEKMKSDRLIWCNSQDIYTVDGNYKLFSMDDFIIKSGERVALLGENGCGKSTFLDKLSNVYSNVEYSENINIHSSLRLAYYDQMTANFNNELSLLDAVIKYCENTGVSTISSENAKVALINAGFPYEKLQDSIKNLSGGERSRAMLVGISLVNSHLLIMDEPTNHIDIQGKSDLAKQLSEYLGGLIIVSHDRKFIEVVCNRFMVIKNHKMIEYNSAKQAYKSLQIT